MPSVVACGVFAGVVAFLLRHAIEAAGQTLWSLLAPLPPWAAAATLLLLIVGVCIVFRPFSRTGLRFVGGWTRPSLLWAVAIGFGVFGLLRALALAVPVARGPQLSLLAETGLVVMAIVLAIGAVAAGEAIGRWLVGRECPGVALPDGFGREPIAVRIAERLRLTKDDGSLNRVIVLGAVGSGKTWVGDRVEALLAADSRPRIVFCRFRAWGFENHAAGVEAMVNSMVERLAELGDVTDLVGLPHALARAVSSVGSPWDAVVEILGAPRDPEAALTRMDEACQELGVRLVLRVEDLERNADHGLVKQLVAGILDRFRRCRAMTVVLEIAPAESSGLGPTTDLLRMADFVETLPGLEPQFVADTLRRFRDSAVAGGVRTWRRGKDFLPTPNAGLEEAEAASDPFAYISCLTDLLRSPRAAGAVVHECEDAWRSLRGEIDVDDLCVAMVLKRCAPSVWQVLVAQPEVFRRGHLYNALTDDRQGRDAGQAERSFAALADRVRKRIDEACVVDGVPATSVQRLLIFLFPRSWKLFIEFAEGPKAPTQGIGTWRPIDSMAQVDYLARLLRGSLRADELSDQTVARHADEWTRGNDPTKLADLIVADPRIAERLRRLNLIPGYSDTYVRSLMAEVARRGATDRTRGGELLSGLVYLRGQREGIDEGYLKWCETTFTQLARHDILWAFAVIDHLVGVEREESGITEATWQRVISFVAPEVERALGGTDAVALLLKMLEAAEPRSLPLLIRRMGAARNLQTSMRVFARAAAEHGEVAYEGYIRQVLDMNTEGPKMISMTSARDAWSLPSNLSAVVPDVEEFWRVVEQQGVKHIQHPGLREDLAEIIEQRRRASDPPAEPTPSSNA